MVKNGQFALKKYLSTCLPQINLTLAPKYAQEGLANIIRSQVLDIDQVGPADLIGEESAWEKMSSGQFSAVCTTDTATVIPFHIKKLEIIVPEIVSLIQQKYRNRFKSRHEMVLKLIDKYNQQALESADIFNQMSSRIDQPLTPSRPLAKEVNKVSRINTLKTHLSQLHTRI